MAIEDLREMNLMQDQIGWEVQYGWSCRLVYFLLHPHGLSWSELRVDSTLTTEPIPMWRKMEKSETTWTLTHCYFANMDGVIRLSPGTAETVTACLGAMLSPKWPELGRLSFK